MSADFVNSDDASPDKRSTMQRGNGNYSSEYQRGASPRNDKGYSKRSYGRDESRGYSSDRNRGLFDFRNRQQLERDTIHEIRKYLYKSKDLKTWKISDEDPLSDSSVDSLLNSSTEDDGTGGGKLFSPPPFVKPSSSLDSVNAGQGGGENTLPEIFSKQTTKNGIVITNVSEVKFDALALPTGVSLKNTKENKSSVGNVERDSHLSPHLKIPSKKKGPTVSFLAENEIVKNKEVSGEEQLIASEQVEKQRRIYKKIKLKNSNTTQGKDSASKITNSANRLNNVSSFESSEGVGNVETVSEDESLEHLTYLGEDYVIRISKKRKRTLARVWILQNLYALAVKRLLLKLKSTIFPNVEQENRVDVDSLKTSDVFENAAEGVKELQVSEIPVEEEEEINEVSVKIAEVALSSAEISRNFQLSSFVGLSGQHSMPIVELGKKNNNYRFALFCLVLENLEKIDDEISDNLLGWRIERLLACKLSLLRLAVAELLFTETPATIVLNEAIDLAKWCLEPGEHRFVNAILESIAVKQQKLKKKVSINVS